MPVIAFCGCALLWLLLVAGFHPQEILLGAGVSLLAVLFFVFVCRSENPRLEFRARDVAQVWQLPWYVAAGIWEVVSVLAQDLVHRGAAKSLYLVAPFDASSKDPVRIARQVLALVYTTATPNFIILAIEQKSQRMLFHQLQRSDIPRMTRNLGAQG